MSETELLPTRVDPAARSDRRRRRNLRRRAVAAAAAGIPLLVILILLLTQVGGDKTPAAAPRPVGNSAEGDQVTYLLVGSRTGDASGQADWLSVMAIDRAGRAPLTFFIPTSTLTEIPGYGYDSAGKALALGRVPLQEITIENMLGISIDHTMLVPDTLLSRMVDRAGGVDVTVKSRLLAPQGTDRLVPVFQPGRQHFDGRRAVRFFEYQGSDEDELARFARAQSFWEALYARFAGTDASKLASIVAGFGSQLITDAPPNDAGAFFAAFAGAGAAAREYEPLPVEAVGGGGSDDAFRVKQDELEARVAALFAGSRPSPGPGAGIRVQILNGNGEPEVGLAVANLLVPAGFRIADTGNASSFGFRRTRIVVYREADLPVAQRIRALLRLGQIEIGRTRQTIVDVTIVVGRDFAARNQ
jgi:anionic cell wall polymer biosynthesis LytR-Cps2A-Psr (LCP) family protein